MANCDKDPNQSSVKKLYELILSAREPSAQLGAALENLIRLSLSSQDHFAFLLHRINWFEPPFAAYRPLFLKICRLYRSTGRQSARVLHNLVVEGFFSPHSQKEALACLEEMLGTGIEQRDILAALRENYPHKLCSAEIHLLYLRSLLSLCRAFKHYRTDILETVVENLVKFDTELVLGDEEVHCPFPHDRKLLELRKAAPSNELALKLDQLLAEVLTYLKEEAADETLLDELLLVFQHKVLPIKTTKNIQLLVFAAAEGSRARASCFLSFLLANIFDTPQQHNWYRTFAQSNFYLASYLCRSKAVSPKTACRTLLLMMQRLNQQLEGLPRAGVDARVNLKGLLQGLELPLLVLQTIVIVRLGNEHTAREDVQAAFEQLLLEAGDRLHYHYFFKEPILVRLQAPQHPANSLRLKFSNKFLPSTLPQTGALTDGLMQLELGPEEPRGAGEAPRKMHKGETPVSYCS
jgi:hypothetical protein